MLLDRFSDMLNLANMMWDPLLVEIFHASPINCLDVVMTISLTVLHPPSCTCRIIDSLHQGMPHIPYRDSKLTRLLKKGLGGRLVLP